MRLLVLGAGNCNDLELATLIAHVDELHLVDLDAESLEAGVAHQQMQHVETVRRHGGVDLSGVLPWVDASSDLPFGDQAAQTQFMSHVRSFDPLATFGSAALPPFDVVASVCLLSQLLEPIVKAVTPQQPLHLPLVQTVRRRHLELLMQWLRPGGVGFFATDFVSSDTAPELAQVSEAELPALLQRLVREQNFFTGLNPNVIQQLLRGDSEWSSRLARVDSLAPWLWNLGPRVYAVCGWRFETTSSRTPR